MSCFKLVQHDILNIIKPKKNITKPNKCECYIFWLVDKGIVYQKKKVLVLIDHIILFHTVEVNGYQKQFGYLLALKYLLLCSA